MNTPNRQYWLTRDGALYADQQAVRRSAGNASYRMQEDWLVGFLVQRAEALGRPVRVLDVGVGFGRMTRVLTQLDCVEYYGSDISETMVAPLLRDPPPGFEQNVRERIRIGADISTLMRGLKFDVVFTVSVLIHNAPEQASESLAQMRAVLAEAGVICLIENRPVSISLLANHWHAGCWSHDVVGTLAVDMDVDVEDGILAEHGIYLIRERAGEDRVVRVPGDSGFVAVSRAEYLMRTFGATAETVRGLQTEIATATDEVANSRDAMELYHAADNLAAEVLPDVTRVLGAAEVPVAGHVVAAVEALRPLVERIRALENVNSALEARVKSADELFHATQQKLLDHERSSAEQASAMESIAWQLGVRERVARLMRAPPQDREPSEIQVQAVLPSTLQDPRSVFQLDATRDIRFAQPLVGHERVCHVMHQEWFGMRAACGSLPGHKLAISSLLSPRQNDIHDASVRMRALNISRVVVHGFSPRMELWIRGLAAAGFAQIYIVWHGAPVMWVHSDERQLLESALKLIKRGIVRRIHGMRPGTHPVFGQAAWVPQIYNMPPYYRPRELRRERRREGAVAFAPSWNLIHKNLYTNVSAAIMTPGIGEVWTLADELRLPFESGKPVKHLPKLDQVQMLETMELTDLVTNASIVDCHPMVELEALAAGTPAVRGRLGLDALEDHPYVALTQVNDPLSIAEVSATMQRILDVPGAELDGMLKSYADSLIALSFARYSEMLEL